LSRVAVRAPLSAGVVGHASETGPLLGVGVMVMVLSKPELRNFREFLRGVRHAAPSRSATR